MGEGGTLSEAHRCDLDPATSHGLRRLADKRTAQRRAGVENYSHWLVSRAGNLHRCADDA